MEINFEQIKEIVITTAQTELLHRFNTVTRNYKNDGSIVTEADLVMQAKLTEALQAVYPDIGFLGEEMTPQQQQMLLDSQQAIWCVDPIDGTSNFAAGLPYFCVSLALIVNQQVILGIIYDPIRDECFSAQLGQGAYLNEQQLIRHKLALKMQNTLALIDYKRLPSKMANRLIVDKPYGSQRSLGSIALELCWIASGRAHLYLHGKQQLWDYAAAQLILSEAGANALTLEGESLFDNSLTSKSTVAAACPDLFQQWYQYLTLIDV